MLRKTISLVLVVLFVVTFFAGCTSKETGKDSLKQATTNSSDQKTAEKEVKTIPKVYYISNSGKLAATQTSNSTKEALEALKAYIIEKTGIEPIPIIPPKGSEAEKLNLMLSSNEDLDLFGGNWLNYYAKGAIQPINQYLDKYGTGIKQMYQKTKMEDLWKIMTDNNVSNLD